MGWMAEEKKRRQQLAVEKREKEEKLNIQSNNADEKLYRKWVSSVKSVLPKGVKIIYVDPWSGVSNRSGMQIDVGNVVRMYMVPCSWHDPKTMSQVAWYYGVAIYEVVGGIAVGECLGKTHTSYSLVSALYDVIERWWPSVDFGIAEEKTKTDSLLSKLLKWLTLD